MPALIPQIQLTMLSETVLFTDPVEEGQDVVDTTLPDGQFIAGSKEHRVVSFSSGLMAKELKELLQRCGAASSSLTSSLTDKTDKPSPHQLFSQTGKFSTPLDCRPTTDLKGPSLARIEKPQSILEGSSAEKTASKRESSIQKTNMTRKMDADTPPLNRMEGKKEELATRISEQTERGKERSQSYNREGILGEREWRKEETKQWWETRYQQRERQGEGEKREHRDHREEDEDCLPIKKMAGIGNKKCFADNSYYESPNNTISKPYLPPPSLGVFALYYILTKMGIYSDGTSNFAYKKEIELIDGETTETHTKRIEELREATKKEKETATWGVMSKVFSWIGSLFAVFTGVALIASGVGAVAGALLIAGGLIQLTNQILEISGGWKKIAALLPGEDSEKKRAVITWMQIGIAVLCLILAGAGSVWGGFASVQETMLKITMWAPGPIAAMGGGVTVIGEGITNFLYKTKIGEVRHHERRLTQLKHQRKDLMEKVELGTDRLEQLFEDLARSLEFEGELFQADQMAIRR